MGLFRHRLACVGWICASWAMLRGSMAVARTIYVDDDAPGDPGPGDPTVSDPLEDGSTAHPFDAIQEGINVAVAGDTVLVADGTYTGTGNKDLDFAGKAITVQSASGNPAACIIDCQGSGRGFYFHSGETAAAVVAGFTIRNGYAIDSTAGGACGAGVYCGLSSPTLTDCTISGNTAHSGASYAYGGGFCCVSTSKPTLTNCTISGNTAFRGGGVSCHSSSNPTLANCTISGNKASYDGGGGVYCEYSSPKLTNCILWADAPQEVSVVASGTAGVTYSDVQGGYAGTADLNLDPLFVNAAAGDYHLGPLSP